VVGDNVIFELALPNPPTQQVVDVPTGTTTTVTCGRAAISATLVGLPDQCGCKAIFP